MHPNSCYRTVYSSLLTWLYSLSLAPSSAQAHLQGPLDSLLPITTLFKIPSVPIHVPLKHTNYSSVCYWDKKAFTDSFDNQKKAKSTAFSLSSSGLPDHEKLLNTDHFEDKNGQPVSMVHICSVYEDLTRFGTISMTTAMPQSTILMLIGIIYIISSIILVSATLSSILAKVPGNSSIYGPLTTAVGKTRTLSRHTSKLRILQNHLISQ